MMKRSDVVQLLLHAAGLDVKLHPWQKNFIDDPSRFRIILKHRGAGATFTIAAEACAEALTHPASTILLISYSLRQSLEIFRHVRTIFSRLENTRLKHGHSIYRLMAKIGARTVELGNGSRIISLPNNPESLRGYRADAVYVDEAAFFRDDTNLKTAIMFTTVARNGRVTLVSTPKGKRGWFHEAWITENTWSKHLVKLGDSPHITMHDLEELRKTMSPLEWRQEMMCEFLDEVNAFISYEKILECVEDFVPARVVGGRVYVGVDFGRFRDSTVIIAVVEDGERLRVCYVEELRQKPFAAQLEAINRANMVLQPAVVAVDSTGMGAPLAETLAKTIPHLQPITITSSTKQILVNNLRNNILNKKLIIPADEKTLINQLRLYQEINTGHSLKYEAPAGEHDDYVMALALACYAAQTSQAQKIEASLFWRWGSASQLSAEKQ